MIQLDFSHVPPPVKDMEVIDCTHIPGTSRYCDSDAEKVLSKLIAGRYSGIHFIDSGNYHYLTKLFTDPIPYPFDLLLLDHHPDMQEPAFAQLLSCGGWLRNMLESNRFLNKVVIAGIDRKLSSLAMDFPGRVTVICEDEVDDVVKSGIFPGNNDEENQTARVPLYISIDKDVLSKDFASTDWDQGTMTLESLEALLKAYSAGREIIGADICGCFPESEGGTCEDASLNLDADRRILRILKGLTPA